MFHTNFGQILVWFFLPISQWKIEESTYDSLSVRSRISFIEEHKKPLNKPIVTKPIISEDPIKEGQFISVGGESTTLPLINLYYPWLGVFLTFWVFFYLGERKTIV